MTSAGERGQIAKRRKAPGGTPSDGRTQHPLGVHAATCRVSRGPRHAPEQPRRTPVHSLRVRLPFRDHEGRRSSAAEGRNQRL